MKLLRNTSMKSLIAGLFALSLVPQAVQADADMVSKPKGASGAGMAAPGQPRSNHSS